VLRLRVASAAVLIPVVVVLLVLGGPWLIALITLVAAMAAWEATALLRGAGLPVDRLLVTALAAGAVLVAGLWPGDARVWAVIVVGAVLTPGFAALRLVQPREGFLAWAGGVFGILYIGLLGAMLGILHEGLPIAPGMRLSGVLDEGRVWLLILVLGVWSYDTFAYAAGRAIGRGPFMTHISPSKTWSGVVGGVVGCVVVTTVLVLWAGQEGKAGVILGLVVAVAAQAGDLVESMLKRAAGAKDSGHLIPGHGGMLDRIDSFLFAAPAFYLVVVLLPYWSRPGG
jgi:phosphatidate cytidylyltransferase